MDDLYEDSRYIQAAVKQVPVPDSFSSKGGTVIAGPGKPLAGKPQPCDVESEHSVGELGGYPIFGTLSILEVRPRYINMPVRTWAHIFSPGCKRVVYASTFPSSWNIYYSQVRS